MLGVRGRSCVPHPPWGASLKEFSFKKKATDQRVKRKFGRIKSGRAASTANVNFLKKIYIFFVKLKKTSILLNQELPSPHSSTGTHTYLITLICSTSHWQGF